MWRFVYTPGNVIAAAKEADKTGVSGKGKERASKHHVDVAFVDTCVQSRCSVYANCYIHVHVSRPSYYMFVCLGYGWVGCFAFLFFL